MKQWSKSTNQGSNKQVKQRNWAIGDLGARQAAVPSVQTALLGDIGAGLGGRVGGRRGAAFAAGPSTAPGYICIVPAAPGLGRGTEEGKRQMTVCVSAGDASDGANERAVQRDGLLLRFWRSEYVYVFFFLLQILGMPGNTGAYPWRRPWCDFHVLKTT
jgi:hypothetical protein